MKLFLSLSGTRPLRELQPMARTTRVFFSLGALFSAETVPSDRGSVDSLYSRVVMVANPKISVVPVLEKWIGEGKPVAKQDLQSMVKKMRSMRRYSHALEISMWMSDRRYFPISPGDAAYRLQLIYKVHGLEHAENYFDNLPKQLKVFQSYGAFLSCYTEEKSVGKAEALFQKMKELNIVTAYSYNALMKLYSDLGEFEKVHTLFQAMGEMGILPDMFSYDILVEAYANAADIKGMEEVLLKINDRKDVANWHIHAVSAKGYLRAGLQDKALVELKKSEKLIPPKKERVAYGFLLSIYADMGDKSKLYRIWNAYKLSEKESNSMYMCMISLLLKSDDIKGAEAILKEWESKFAFYDFRVPNLLINAYCTKGLLSKAEALVDEIIQKGRTPFANTWDRLASAYFKDGQILKAVEMEKKALVAGQIGWNPNPANAIASLEHLMEQKDVEAAEEFVRLLRRLVPLTRDVYHHLLKTYLNAEKSVSDLLDRMNKDGFEADVETLKILEDNSYQDKSESHIEQSFS
ncbi:pentatricopeptide repeat-containing protein At2g20710, mitochondrial-like [Typha latifolia]|uniref:pentatricopeptide repeat-containing protein At2g20710, mitochondrial-like n=1 Tax=Typha latifolia TaxID=4733 RepID=UPI003C2DCF1E